MPWAALIPIIATYGLPFAQYIWVKSTTAKDVTPEDFDELNKLAAQTPESHLAAAVAKAGIDPNDPRVKALADLIAAA